MWRWPKYKQMNNTILRTSYRNYTTQHEDNTKERNDGSRMHKIYIYTHNNWNMIEG